MANAGWSGEGLLTDLPMDLQEDVLCRLPLRDLARVRAVCRGWSPYWHQYRLTFDSSSADSGTSKEFASRVDRRIDANRGRRIRGLSFALRPADFRNLSKWLRRTAGCQVEDLSVTAIPGPRGGRRRLVFSWPPPTSQQLVRFALHSAALHFDKLGMLRIAGGFSGLQALSLRDVAVSGTGIRNVLRSCRELRNLDIRRCSLSFLNLSNLGARLCTLTVVDCPCLCRILLPCGRYISPRNRTVPVKSCSVDAPSCLVQLCVSFPHSPPPNCSDRCLLAASGVLSNVRVLTLCSAAIKQSAATDELPALRELQLVMRTMTCEDLTNVYRILRRCHRKIERLFVQLPARSSCDDPPVAGASELPIEVETLQCTFDNLVAVKMCNFWSRANELSLVRALLKSGASTVRDLVLIAPLPQNLLQLYNIEHDQLILAELEYEELKDIKIKILVKDDDSFLPTHRDLSA